MKKYLLFVTYIFSFGLLFQSCEKDSDTEIIISSTPVPLPTVKKDTVWEDESSLQAPSGVILSLFSIEKLTKDLQDSVSIDTFIAEKGGKIEKNDFTIEIPSGGCVNKGNGQPCKGSVEVNFLLIRSRGEMITHDRSTVAQGKLFSTGGVIFIGLKQGSQEVRLALNKTIKIKFKTNQIESGMQLFDGLSSNRFQFDWQPTSLTSRYNTVSTWEESSQQKKGYEVQIDHVGWISCVKFNDATSLTNKLCVSLPDSFTNRNTSVYVVFKDMVSVVKLEGSPLLKQFCLPLAYKGLPIDKQVTIVAISNSDGRTYVGYQEVKLTANNVIRLQAQSITTEELRKKILNL